MFQSRTEKGQLRRVRHTLYGTDKGHRKGIQERDRMDHKARRIRADSSRRDEKGGGQKAERDRYQSGSHLETENGTLQNGSQR